MKRFLLPFLPLAFVAPAFAGNIAPVYSEPAPIAPVTVAPTYTWGGGYVGVQAGYGDIRPGGTADLDDDDDDDGDSDDTDNVSFGDDLDGDGGLFGLRAGYDMMFGRTLVGGFAQYDKASIDLGDDVELDSILRLGLRAGLTSGRNMYYATGGYAQADTDDIGTADGYFAGLGYEVFLTQKVTLGAEALYHDFDEFDGGDDDIDAKATTVGLNLNYRF